MSEVIEYRPPGPPSTGPAAELVAWAHAGDAAYALARRLTATNIVPDQYRGKPDEAAAAILMGAEVGLSPIAALRSLFVIRGTVGMYVRAQLALVQSKGHRVWTEHETDDTVTVVGHRAGDPEHLERVTWDLARAQRAGLIRRGRNGDPSAYESQPRTMLWNRATGDLCRRIAADVLAGIPEAPWDAPEPTPGAVEPAPGGGRTIQRRTPATQSVAGGAQDRGAGALAPNVGDAPPPPASPPTGEDTLPIDDPPDGDDTPAPHVVDPDPDHNDPRITPAQRARIMAALNGRGLREHDERVGYLSALVGHDISSTNDLTTREASMVIDTISAG